MNKWQEKYCKDFYKGKMPRSSHGKADMALLGQIKNVVTVEFTDRTETYTVTEDECDIPNGKIFVQVLASNLTLWLSRGYNTTTND